MGVKNLSMKENKRLRDTPLRLFTTICHYNVKVLLKSIKQFITVELSIPISIKDKSTKESSDDHDNRAVGNKNRHESHSSEESNGNRGLHKDKKKEKDKSSKESSSEEKNRRIKHSSDESSSKSSGSHEAANRVIFL